MNKSAHRQALELVKGALCQLQCPDQVAGLIRCCGELRGLVWFGLGLPIVFQGERGDCLYLIISRPHTQAHL